MKLRLKNPNLSSKERKAAKLLGRGEKLIETARKVGVVAETVCEWEQKPKFQELMAKEAEKELTKLEKAQDEVDEVLIESAKLEGFKGAPDRKTFYQVLGKLITRLKSEGSLDIEVKNLKKLSDEELEAEARRLLGLQAKGSERSEAPGD